jgi:molecular chaperone HtpG
LMRFASTKGDGDKHVVDLAGYIERMPEGQDAIYYITAENHQAASNSPHLEMFRKKDIEVLLMSDRVDEWMMAYFTEFDDKPFKSVAKGDIDLDALGKDEAKETDSGETSDPEALDADLLKKVADTLDDRVSEARSSQRLTDSASCLVLGEQEMALHLQRLLEQAGQDLPDSRPVLELNPGHPLVNKLKTEEDEQRFSDLSLVLFEQALLSEGGSLADPAGFVRRVNALMS